MSRLSQLPSGGSVFSVVECWVGVTIVSQWLVLQLAYGEGWFALYLLDTHGFKLMHSRRGFLLSPWLARVGFPSFPVACLATLHGSPNDAPQGCQIQARLDGLASPTGLLSGPSVCVLFGILVRPGDPYDLLCFSPLLWTGVDTYIILQ